MPDAIAPWVSTLAAAVQTGTAIRCITPLMPAGGAGDKVFPPTYPNPADKDERGRDRPMYAAEIRLIEGQPVPCVLMDSVQSQANRLEAALLAAHDRGHLPLPLLATHIEGAGRVTTLDAPHRVYDAIFQDSMLDGVRFRQSDLGQRLLTARPQTATALYTYCPTVLLFGGWDSHAGDGGRGARIARALTSEIVGMHTTAGLRPASRLDPLGIEREAGPIYAAADADERWTLDESAARQNQKSPVKYGDGSPSRIGHGNITPSLVLGGVTLAEARQIAVLSLPQLRRLRFPHPATGETSVPRDEAARLVLAALGLYALTLQIEQGFDLRSRCVLLPVETPRFELLGPTHREVERLEMDATTGREVLQSALAQAEAHGLQWHREVITLHAQPKLNELVQRSRANAGRDTESGGEGDAGTLP
jgi:CRISPR-associated protein Csb1